MCSTVADNPPPGTMWQPELDPLCDSSQRYTTDVAGVPYGRRSPLGIWTVVSLTEQRRSAGKGHLKLSESRTSGTKGNK